MDKTMKEFVMAASGRITLGGDCPTTQICGRRLLAQETEKKQQRLNEQL